MEVFNRREILPLFPTRILLPQFHFLMPTLALSHQIFAPRREMLFGPGLSFGHTMAGNHR